MAPAAVTPKILLGSGGQENPRTHMYTPAVRMRTKQVPSQVPAPEIALRAVAQTVEVAIVRAPQPLVVLVAMARNLHGKGGLANLGNQRWFTMILITVQGIVPQVTGIVTTTVEVRQLQEKVMLAVTKRKKKALGMSGHSQNCSRSTLVLWGYPQLRYLNLAVVVRLRL